MVVPHALHAQLQSSSLVPHHRVWVRYSADKLAGDGHRGLYDMMPIENSANRYEPLGLDDEFSHEQIVHPGWDPDVYPHCSFHTGAGEYSREDGTPPRAENPLLQLLEDLAFATQFIGETRINFVTSKDRRHRGPVSERHLEVAVCRRTCFLRDRLKVRHRPENNYFIEAEVYHFKLTDFVALVDNYNMPAWWYHMDDLIFRRSDYAVKSIAGFMQRHLPAVFDHNEHTWREPRQASLETALRPLIVPVEQDAPPEDEECAVCTYKFGTEDCDPVLLPCNHTICKTCLVNWCASGDVAEATCPQCRHKIFLNQDYVDLLTFGLVGDKTYISDPRFTAWENWERSCTDLDRHLAEYDHSEITIHPDRLREALDLVLRNAKLETRYSTRTHQQLARAPELNNPSFTTCISKALNIVCATAVPQRISFVDSSLRTNFLHHFLRQIHANGLEPFTPLNDAERTGRSEHFWLRPGLEDFLRRSVSRALMILKLRRCRRPQCNHERFWHRHGDRDFWSPRDDPDVVRARMTPQISPTSYRSRSRSSSGGRDAVEVRRSPVPRVGRRRDWLSRLVLSSRPTGVQKRLRGSRPYPGT